jgi:Tol biopolymer transport system component
MLVYISGGDVWLADLDNDEHTRLTHDGYNIRPRLSPDLKWAAYLKGGFLHLLNIRSGNEVMLSETGISDYAWSAGEVQLAYLSSDGLAIWDAGTQVSREIPVDLKPLSHLAWDPAGKLLAVDNREGTPRSIRIISSDGSADRLLYSAPDLLNVPRLAGWSADGQRVMFWLGSRAEAVAQDGLSLCWVPLEGGQPTCPGGVSLLRADNLSWSPDGQLALISGGMRETWVGKGLHIVDLETPSSTHLILPQDQAPLHPDWSPDGKRIVYSAGPAIPLNKAYESRDLALQDRQIWMIEIESGRRQQLTGNKSFRDEHPLWSSDGSRILFVRLNEQSASLWLMNADGSDLHQIVTELTPRPDPSGEYGFIAWDEWWDWSQ